MTAAAIRSVVVFCGSRPGADPAYAAAAAALGRGLAGAGIRLVYGGGKIGLMGIVADAALAAGGEVLGVIPEFLRAREVAHGQVDQLIITETMHERKARMANLADAFITLPGGLGTLDEMFEILTWRQLGLHNKPILLCDVAGWGGSFMALVNAVITAGFAGPETAALFEMLPGVPATLARLAAGTAGGYSPLSVGV